MAIIPFLKRNSRTLTILLTPVIFLPLPLVLNSAESKCAYGLILMAVYWTTEAFPLSVTAMLPIVIFPMMGISKVKDLAREYYTDITFVFFGGLSVAIAIEKWNVHRRFALRLLLLMGSKPKWLMLGFMLTTSFLSMWVSNTATTSMMIPIARAVLVQLFKTRKLTSVHSEDHEKEKESNNVEDNEIKISIQGDKSEIQNSKRPLVSSSEKDDTIDFENLDKESQRLCKAVCLCICYAANCGGVATLTGTGPNLVMKGQADLLAGGKSGITFLTWFIFSFPVAFINVFICWFVLQLMFFGWRELFKSSEEESTAAADVIRNEYKKLGNVTFAEKAVLVHFVVLVILWFTLEPEFAPGWGSFFPHGYLGDAVPAIIILFMLFIFPSEWNSKKDGKTTENGEVPRLLNWQIVVERLPWGVAILLGGGFALARACRESGLSVWLAAQLAVFSSIPPWAMVLIICIIVSFSTEVTSNTAICTIYMPILAELALGIQIHPIYVMLPAAISTSFAFMLPVATPPNTIVFSYGYLKVMDMVKIGIVLNFLCVLVVSVAINTWGRAYFNLDTFPDWGVNTQLSHFSVSSNITTSITDVVNITNELTTISDL